MDETNVYPHSWETARDNGELEVYRKSNELNIACMQAIDKAIADSNYERDRYNLAKASETVISEYGFERVNWVLAGLIQRSYNDARYSQTNREWAKNFYNPDRCGPVSMAHQCLLNGLVDEVRKAHIEMLTEAIGAYEKKRRLAERNRLTWFNSDFGAFILKEGISHSQLMERYSVIITKNKR